MIQRIWEQAYLSPAGSTRRMAQQTILAVLLGVSVTGILLFVPGMSSSPVLWIGTGLLIAATVASIAVPWDRFGQGRDIVIPLTDLVAVGCVRLATLPEGSSLSLLMFFPAVWLVVNHRRLGILLAVSASFLLVTVPNVLSAENPADFLLIARSLLLPLVIFMISVMIVGLYDRLEAARARADNLSRMETAGRDEARRLSRLLRSIGESLSVGVLVLDKEGNDLMWNRAQRRIHALASPPENEDKTEAGHLVFRSDGRTSIPAERRPAYRAAHGETFENMLMCVGAPGAEQVALSVSARPVVNTEGEKEGSVIVMNDVTEIRAAMKAREEFLANVSHELRTPLTSILGYIELSKDEVGGPDADLSVVGDYMDVAKRNGEQLLALVEDLLLEQQSQAGKLVLNFERHRVSDLASHVLRSLQPLAAEKGIELIGECENTPESLLDSSRMVQVFSNLVSNGIKYNRSGGRVTVSTGVRSGDIEFTVSDDGPGLDAEDAANLFTPFFRGKSGMLSKTSGAGLGMAIVKSITQAHGGFVSVVETALGKGLTCRVTLPASGPLLHRRIEPTDATSRQFSRPSLPMGD